jgi:hypothetical protein
VVLTPLELCVLSIRFTDPPQGSRVAFPSVLLPRIIDELSPIVHHLPQQHQQIR